MESNHDSQISSQQCKGKLKVNCNVCASPRLTVFLTLPNYPLNSIFVDAISDKRTYFADYGLYQCTSCFHIQGESSFSLNDLYNAGYSYAANTEGVHKRMRLLVERIAHTCKDKQFNRVIDIGCNQMAFLKMLKDAGLAANHWIGIDPVPLRQPTPEEGFTFIQGYIQEVDIPWRDNNLPDLMVADQVLEHIPSTHTIIQELSDASSPESLLFIGVPSIELIIDNLSFQHIIHEHVNYFSESALAKCFLDSDFDLQSSQLNNECSEGYLFQTYKKSPTTTPRLNRSSVNHAERFKKMYDLYRHNLELSKSLIQAYKDAAFGFGASVCTGTLAYFMQSDFDFLVSIFDDTAYKNNKYIPGLKPQVINLPKGFAINNSVIFITAPHVARSIIHRLIPDRPQRIINPLQVF
jgi:2-polyprenyl-3-methyl-5-hydroxy-6-metoxy-1,4-benzoquinol methylase